MTAQSSTPFGERQGEQVDSITISSPDNSTSATLITFGAAIHDLRVPVQGSDEKRSVIIGFDQPEGYFANPQWHHGAVAGRVANRIANGRFDIEGTSYQVSVNEPSGHVCHGGKSGFGHRVWTIVENDEQSATFELVSPDGDQGFPGEVRARLTYSIPSRGVLRLDYSAVADKATPVSLTNHSFFNLDGTRGQINTTLQQNLVIHADKITAVDAKLIPTGEYTDVAGTPYDFRTSRPIQFGDANQGGYFHYDTNFVLRANPVPGVLHPGAEMTSTSGDLKMECWTDQPGIQFFDAAPMNLENAGLGGSKITNRTGICLETQLFPDWIHQPGVTQSVIGPGDTYKHLTEYRFF